MDTNRRAALRGLFAAFIVAGAVTPSPAAAFFFSSVERPPAAEFGPGPRASANQLYRVTLQPAQPLRLRQLLTVPVLVVDAQGSPVESAAITVDGGMPEHSHGLPTQPRVTRSRGGGVYEIEGLRFSMGGWWELRLSIESPAGADRVTFNLSL